MTRFAINEFKLRQMAKRLPGPVVNVLSHDYKKETHINRALRATKGQTYVEIGVRNGDCFRAIGAPRKIAIDPAPGQRARNLGLGESLYEMTSDAFFADVADEVLGNHEVDVALVDGLHEFSQTLRDIVSLEKLMSPRGIVFVHDCNPPTRSHVDELDGRWNGDVWKCAYYLTTFRPDLRFFTLNCDWGLGVLSGFHSDRSPSPPAADVVSSCKSLDFSLLERKRRDILQLRPAWYSRWFFGAIRAIGVRSAD